MNVSICQPSVLGHEKLQSANTSPNKVSLVKPCKQLARTCVTWRKIKFPSTWRWRTCLENMTIFPVIYATFWPESQLIHSKLKCYCNTLIKPCFFFMYEEFDSKTLDIQWMRIPTAQSPTQPLLLYFSLLVHVSSSEEKLIYQVHGLCWRIPAQLTLDDTTCSKAIELWQDKFVLPFKMNPFFLMGGYVVLEPNSSLVRSFIQRWFITDMNIQTFKSWWLYIPSAMKSP